MNTIRGLTLHYLYSLRRNPARFIEMFFWPTFELLIYLLLTRGISDSVPEVVSSRLIIGTGVIYWIITARIIQESIAQLVDDFFSKNIQHILIAPVRLFDLLVSLFLSAVLKLIPSLLVLIFVIMSLGQAQLLSIVITGIIPTILLIFFGLTLALFAIACVFVFGERMSFVGWVLSTIIQVVSCVYYSRDSLPTALQQISYLVPSSYIFESIQSYIQSGTWNNNLLYIASLMTTVYFIINLKLVYISFHYAQKNGSLTKS